MNSRMLCIIFVPALNISSAALAQSADPSKQNPPGESSAEVLSVTPTSEASKPVDVANYVRYHIGAGTALATLNTTSRYGLGQNQIYSKSGTSFELDAFKWRPWQTSTIGLGISSTVQSLNFDGSSDGTRDAVNLNSFQINAGPYISTPIGVEIGLVAGIHNDIVIIAPPVGNAVIGLSSSLAYGLDAGYSYSINGIWKLSGRFKQFLTEGTKVKSVKIERGAGYCAELAPSYALSAESMAKVAYRYCRARQDTAFSRIERLQDYLSVAYDASIAW